MSAVVTSLWLLAMRTDERIAHVALSPDPLPDLLVHQVLTTRPAGASQFELFRVVVAWDYRHHLLMLPCEFVSPPTVGISLRLVSLDGIAGALLAPLMLTGRTLVVFAEVGIALVACSVNAHAHRFLHPKNIAFRRMEFAGLDLQAKPRTQIPGALFVDLNPRYPCGILIGWQFP